MGGLLVFEGGGILGLGQASLGELRVEPPVEGGLLGWLLLGRVPSLGALQIARAAHGAVPGMAVPPAVTPAVLLISLMLLSI